MAKKFKRKSDHENVKDKERSSSIIPVKKAKKSCEDIMQSKILNPLKSRLKNTRIFIGAHVSMANGIENSIANSIQIGGNAFAIFLKSQRRWESPIMLEENTKRFIKMCEEHNFDFLKHILPHGSYLINLAQSDPAKSKQAYDCFLDDLKRCESLNIGKFNFHPGSYASCGEEQGISKEEQGISNVASCINKAIKETKFVKIVLENMAGHGSILGGKFEQIAEIISQVEKKDRVGVCLDTCHMFAAGYDIRTREAYEKTMEEFDRLIGFKYLCGWHINDSRAELGENRDLHANIGYGFLGIEPFRLIVNDPRNNDIPLILETPAKEPQIWAEEIELLESLIGKEADDPKIEAKLIQLQEKGKSDRAIQQEKAQRKKQKKDKKS